MDSDTMLSRNQKIVAVVGLVALMSVFAFSPRSGITKLAIAAGTPDAYGQRIYWVAVYQLSNITSLWVLKDNVTYSEYTGGYDVNINPNEAIRFFACGGINNGFAASAGEALSYARTYITITGEVAKTLMTDDNASALDTGTYYNWGVVSHYYWSPSGGKPIAGETYSVIFNFECYFDPDDYVPP